MKIIITGGLGHIGSRLIRDLPELIDVSEIIIIDSLTTQRYSSLFNLPFKTKYTFIHDDVRYLKGSSLKRCSDANLLIHLAAINDLTSGTLTYSDLEANNLNATLAAISICEKLDVPLIFPSSTSIYTSTGLNIAETEPLRSNPNVYARCKTAEEDSVNEYFARGGRGIIFRLGTIHGKSEGMRFHTAINKFCYQIAIGEPISIWRSALNQKRPYLGLLDLVRAISFVISNKAINNETYNLVTKNYSITEVLKIFEKVTEISLNITIEDNDRMNDLDLHVSNEKFLNTGFIYSASIEKDISETLKLLGNLR
jgi:UDP-glucose 4-epimerase